MSLLLTKVPPRTCPNCDEPPGAEEHDYDCPNCGMQFCSHCYKPDYTGNGTYVLCPGCKEKLYFALVH